VVRDVSGHLEGNEVVDGEALAYPVSDLRGGHLDVRHLHQMDLRPVRSGIEVRQVEAGTRHHHDLGKLRQTVELLP
jgi:hypothetical protein